MTASIRFRVCSILLLLGGIPLLSPPSAHGQVDRRRPGQDRDEGRNITCSSAGGYQRCAAPGTWRGARLVRQLSDAACTKGVTWGFERDYIWVTRGCRGVFDPGDPVADLGERVTCSSGGRYVRCPADTHRGVTLVRQLSERACVQGRTWGAESGFIWVNRGCRAEFMVGHRGGPGGPGGPGRPGGPGGPDGPGGPGRETTVVCESTGGYHHCPVRFSERGARLVRQLSDAACTQGRTWGFDRDGIWVDRGCRGVFAAGDPSADPGERVTCSSDGRMRSCPANTSRGVELVRQLSDARCRAGYSWGYDRGYIWVDRGCRAEFRLGGRYSPIRRQ